MFCYVKILVCIVMIFFYVWGLGEGFIIKYNMLVLNIWILSICLFYIILYMIYLFIYDKYYVFNVIEVCVCLGFVFWLLKVY